MSSEVGHRNIQGLILVWAFAESGIGGILHALKLPFTGILVGGIAVVCIALMGFFATSRATTIMSALGIVLLVKLTVSPHSPWQAYVAVVFQGWLGAAMFSSRNFYRLKCLVFSVLCLLESALQKILLTLLIYGKQLMEAIDKAALSLASSLGIHGSGSIVIFAFGMYVLLHLAAGLAIGRWIPSIPSQLAELDLPVSEISGSPVQAKEASRQTGKHILIGFLGLTLLLVALKMILPELKISDLALIFVRSVLVSLALIFIAGPLLVRLIRRMAGVHKSRIENQVLAQTLDQIPVYSAQAYEVMKWSQREFTGFLRIKKLILGLLFISLYRQS